MIAGDCYNVANCFENSVFPLTSQSKNLKSRTLKQKLNLNKQNVIEARGTRSAIHWIASTLDISKTNRQKGVKTVWVQTKQQKQKFGF